MAQNEELRIRFTDKRRNVVAPFLCPIPLIMLESHFKRLYLT